ncbi:low temperature requirement protein A [Dysgonomonas macrotermitis]|uniref:Low temperature requirement protein LtrA n=1 Tax=Dysgonomonas macrotermitis TaxID=1346286 RepID=A0A1M5HE03_9BACT|nr:low temperature requirement protein A [Dysgonomonas macrotermitis]SHG14151.1 Low temperature requirement protein LtrA [Dysgonomonas macrotermitis]
MAHASYSSHSLLRKRGEGIASVSFSELLFDLIYVFAVTQLSHYFLHHLDLTGFLQSTVLWFAVWLGWQHTTWMTNWFDPNIRSIRGILFMLMILGLLVAAALPEAFGERGWIFALCYVIIQVGRTAAILFMLGRKHQLTPNYTRIFGWFVISAIFWIAGAFQEPEMRLILWAIAVLCDYTAPMFGFYLPFLGKSDPAKDWTIDGHHLAERSQLFVIIAFGETILMSGASLSEIEVWTAPVVMAAIISFLSSLAMWWIYFDSSSEAGAKKIMKVDNPGLLGLKYHSIHVILVGALILCAVGDELVVNHPLGHMTGGAIFVVIVGPIIYLIANMVYKWFTCRIIAKSHIIAIVSLAILIVVSPHLNLIIANALSVSILVFISIYEVIDPKKHKPEEEPE